MKGTIKKKMPQGFGFIAPEDGGKDIFFHSSDVVGATFDELGEGDTVSYEVQDKEFKGEMKTNAVNVQRA